MTKEQKAKAYDEAITTAKQILSNNYSVVEKLCIECVFPELKESEDERIRKALICGMCALKEQHKTCFASIPIDNAIAWLEKQCEQKPIDKVESKFKVGDWIVQGCNILKIRCFDDKYYCFETVEGYVDHMLISEIDSLYHLWTIQDAKDGYILVDNYENIGIFEKVSGMVWYSYCYLGCNGGFIYENYGGAHNLANVNPANKEQRDLLFQKMHEAGYEWDAEKKELKKIEQKPTDEEMKTLLRTEYEKGRADAITEFQKAWSEEDESYLNTTIAYFKDAKEFKKTADNCINWLKSLKDRVQPKQEWSEEDEERIIKKACEFMRNHIDPQLTIYHEQTWCKRDEFIKKFYKYMKGE